MAALTRAGLTPIDCGPIPTPALALYGPVKAAPSRQELSERLAA